MARIERRLIPIVSLDVEGYTRFVQRDEAATLAVLNEVFTERGEATIGEHGGLIFKRMGDGILAEFASVVAAVEWAVRLQQSLHEQPVMAPGGQPIRLRAGIVMADVMIQDGDRYGEGVSLAVRLQSQAPAGGLAITKWMHDYLAGKIDLAFTDIGPQILKNVGHPVHVFVWHPDANVQRLFAEADVVLDCRVNEEACPMNLVPTASTTSRGSA